MSVDIIILAAGQGTRMRSALPKVLHKLAGVSLLERVIQTAQQLTPDNIFVVYGHAGEQIRAQAQHLPVTWVAQQEQRGTGHAVLQVLPYLKNPNAQVVILYADTPLLNSTTIKELLEKTSSTQVGLLTTQVANPFGFGRIVRDRNNAVIKIVEEKDATPEQQLISEINPGIYALTAKNLQQWLPLLTADNAQQEFLLTDIIDIAVKEGIAINATAVANSLEVMGINDRAQLIALERIYQQQLAKQFLVSGVTIIDPARFDVRGNATLAQDVTVDINVVLEGNVAVNSHSTIGPNCLLKNVTIGKNVEIKANCVIEDAVIGDDCKIGPFARIRPGTELAANVSVGNFVEIKKSHIGSGSKIPHLSYVGDAVLGEKVNFSAGAITCNYDGANKHQTVIGNNVFIGSDSQLIAPITIADGAFIAAGSTITKNAPANKLTLSRAKQQTIENWQRPQKEEK